MPATAAAFLVFLLFAPAAQGSLPPAHEILADAKIANDHFTAHPSGLCTTNPCAWTVSTYHMGLLELFRSTQNTSLYDYTYNWAKSNDWRLCYNGPAGQQSDQTSVETADGGPPPIKPKGADDADNQIIAAIYAELFAYDPKPEYIANAVEVLSKEINGTKTNYWSWIDAIHMGMNAYSRVGNATGDDRFFETMFKFYQVTALDGNPPDGINTFRMWNNTVGLFYRDDRFLGSNTFWGRGNGWAITAMVRSLQVLPAGAKFDADRHEYSTKLFTMAHALKSVQSENGCWGASLMNATAFPGPETTGTANFCYALAYGVRTGILDRSSFLPAVQKAWQCLSKTALQPSGLVGYCQPCGGAPNATTAAETSDFCVGQFLLAATEVARLSEVLAAEEGA